MIKSWNENGSYKSINENKNLKFKNTAHLGDWGGAGYYWNRRGRKSLSISGMEEGGGGGDLWKSSE